MCRTGDAHLSCCVQYMQNKTHEEAQNYSEFYHFVCGSLFSVAASISPFMIRSSITVLWQGLATAYWSMKCLALPIRIDTSNSSVQM